MTAIAIKNFTGQFPIVTPRNLAADQAQIATNCDLDRGSLAPLDGVSDPLAGVVTITGAKKTIYRWGQTQTNEGLHWASWAADVDVVKGPVPGDLTERTFYTGDGAPKVFDQVTGIVGSGVRYPAGFYLLGVPAPVAKPSVSVVGDPADSSTAPVFRSYVQTFVNGWGWESQPSPATDPVEWREGQTISLSGLEAPPSGAYNFSAGAARRIYRSAGAGALFLVAELPIALATFTDDIADDSLGEIIPSTDWAVPPSDMKGLISLPNSVMAGFTGNQVCLCEPERPFAWPFGYRYTVDYPIVGIEAIGSSIIVTTTAHPYIITGAHPSAMSADKMETVPNACVSKRGIVGLGGVVAYPSSEGIVAVGAAGADIPTSRYFTLKQWKALNPASIHAYAFRGRYYAFYDATSIGGKKGGFIFDPSNAGAGIVFHDYYCDTAFVDPQRATMYVANGTLTTGNIRKWESGAPMSATWRSKVFVADRPINFGFAQVIASAYPLTLKLYADGALKHSQTVANKVPFRLPGDALNDEFEIEAVTDKEIFQIVVAQTAEELRRV